MEVTFFDPVSAETKASVMRRIWACTSYRDVLELPDETVSTSRIAVARSVLECLLHPSHNEFEGCHCAMHFIKQSAEGLLARAEFRNLTVPGVLAALSQKPGSPCAFLCTFQCHEENPNTSNTAPAWGLDQVISAGLGCVQKKNKKNGSHNQALSLPL